MELLKHVVYANTKMILLNKAFILTRDKEHLNGLCIVKYSSYMFCLHLYYRKDRIDAM